MKVIHFKVLFPYKIFQSTETVAYYWNLLIITY